MPTLCRAADGGGGYLRNGGDLGEREGGQGGEALLRPGQQSPAPDERAGLDGALRPLLQRATSRSGLPQTWQTYVLDSWNRC
jgi:hypothetical protein